MINKITQSLAKNFVTKKINCFSIVFKTDRFSNGSLFKLARYRPKRGGLATARTVNRSHKPQNSKQMLVSVGREND